MYHEKWIFSWATTFIGIISLIQINTYQNKKKPFKKTFFSNFDLENQIPSFFTITVVTSEAKYMGIRNFQIFGGKCFLELHPRPDSSGQLHNLCWMAAFTPLYWKVLFCSGSSVRRSQKHDVSSSSIRQKQYRTCSSWYYFWTGVRYYIISYLFSNDVKAIFFCFSLKMNRNFRTDRSCYYDIFSWNSNEGWRKTATWVSFTLHFDQICFMVYTDTFASITWMRRSLSSFQTLTATCHRGTITNSWWLAIDSFG